MRLIITLSLLLAARLAFFQAPASATLTTNRVKAVVNANGALFTDLQKGQFVAPFIPGQPEIGLLRGAGLWLTGLDPAGNLKGAVQLFNTNEKSDFSPGILDGDGLPASVNLTGIFRVTRAEIQAHLADLADNGVIDNPQPGVLGWPARGNPFFEQYHPGQSLSFTLQGLAGFYDADADGAYNPMYGDYPAIELLGCPFNRIPTEMLWFAFNDAGAHTESGMKPVQMEIQCQIFAYDCTEESPLRNTVFVRYKLINRSTEPIEDMHLGLFNAFEIGHPGDDFFGSDPAAALIFGYNGDNLDEGAYGSDIPAMGVKIFRGPLNAFGQNVPLAHIMPVDPATISGPVAYYNLLHGLFIDGAPAPNNGIFYPGNPNDPGAGSEVKAGNTPGTRQVLTSYGPFTLLPGAVNELIAGYFYAAEPGQTPVQNVQTLYAHAKDLQDIFDSCFGPASCTGVVKTAELPANSTGLRIFPNPACNAITIEAPSACLQRIYLIDATGRRVKNQFWSNPHQNTTLPVEHLPSGMYWVEIYLANGQVAQKKVVVQHP